MLDSYSSQIERAAQDSDLIIFLENEMVDDYFAPPSTRRDLIESMTDDEVIQFRQDWMRCYHLTETSMPRALGRAVASVANIQLGKDFFDGKT